MKIDVITTDEQQCANILNPFHLNYSVFRWDEAHRPAYQKIRRGHPDIIDQKSRQYSEAKSKAERSLTRIDAARAHLDPNAFAFFRFKLEENLFHLELSYPRDTEVICRLLGEGCSPLPVSGKREVPYQNLAKFYCAEVQRG